MDLPSHPMQWLMPSRKGPHRLEGSQNELQLTPNRRKAQLQQHNPWHPLRWCSHKEIGHTVKLLFPPNLQSCVETQPLKITLWKAQNLKRGTSSLWHHQVKNHDHRSLHGKTMRSQQAHGAWRHLLDTKLPVWAAVSHRLHLPGCPSPGPRPVPQPQFQTWRHHKLVPSRHNEHYHVDVTIGKHNYVYFELKKITCIPKLKPRAILPIYPEKR